MTSDRRGLSGDDGSSHVRCSCGPREQIPSPIPVMTADSCTREETAQSLHQDPQMASPPSFGVVYQAEHGIVSEGSTLEAVRWDLSLTSRGIGRGAERGVKCGAVGERR
jgi:hypothetical protein